ncbi:hypothetical protein Poly30_38510 [Planctomycetes bacterium Poly30]|uniref:Uncharacterized protein n=1 Tax=Saltatorellus ferox TaxID=2528018 RepID=A0A518EW64_9BACT|nr:hypothetical protein Poly30_38510 [Planctomycetes bacterium Poly30]
MGISIGMAKYCTGGMGGVADALQAAVVVTLICRAVGEASRPGRVEGRQGAPSFFSDALAVTFVD